MIGNETPTQAELERVYTLVRAVFASIDNMPGEYRIIGAHVPALEEAGLEVAEEGEIIREIRRIIYNDNRPGLH